MPSRDGKVERSRCCFGQFERGVEGNPKELDFAAEIDGEVVGRPPTATIEHSLGFIGLLATWLTRCGQKKERRRQLAWDCLVKGNTGQWPTVGYEHFMGLIGWLTRSRSKLWFWIINCDTSSWIFRVSESDTGGGWNKFSQNTVSGRFFQQCQTSLKF